VKQRIVLLGPPASGKGTQAEMIQARYQFPITSPGAILREERKLGTALGLSAEKATSQGQLVPDEVVNAVVKSWISRHGSAFVFDGYPRSLGQACSLEDTLAKRNTPLEVVLLLAADEQTIRSRVERRMMCEICGRIVSIGLQVANAADRCPTCAGKLVKRLDDSPATLELRMREYAAKTEPLITFYRQRNLLKSVDATGAPEAVFESIARILEGE
jgi:adenylate kinase